MTDEPEEELFAALNLLRLNAGQPSYRDIARKTRGQVSSSSVHNVLRYHKVPLRWEPGMLAIVRALGGDEQHIFRLWQHVLLGRAGGPARRPPDRNPAPQHKIRDTRGHAPPPVDPALPLPERTRLVLAKFDTEDKHAGSDYAGMGTRYAQWFADLLEEWNMAGNGGQPITVCCGFDMAYEEFADVRRYHCTYRDHHPVIYVDQRDGTWERRA